MSRVYCPMCGWHKDRLHFKPEEMGNNIWSAEVHGKGKGRGFWFEEEISLLSSGDDLVKRIGQRCLTIINFLIESGDLFEDEVRDELGFANTDDDEEDEESDESAGDSPYGFIGT